MSHRIIDPERLAGKARSSISRFCIDECRAYCCRSSYLPLKDEEIDAVTQGRRDELEDKGLLFSTGPKGYSLKLDHDSPCPSLKDNRCTIYRSRKRPRVCRQFPLFIKGRTVRLSPRCLAVKSGLFYPYIRRFVAGGYRIDESEAIFDSDFFEKI